ncbi:hypothetical protein [Rubrivirga marina]|uniref:Uncharacterized protein n=1 Tax=Rubrivirga marina TaxID=1196024 RepID=A0A271IUT4_9BACT|nr:hypothetical protein [Rubrivirga marina]PAP74678.1 hypothetical protein BSZ37_20220 [Rubrivirga marina]PAP77204.1 hypothetical protein BSZ37_12565 [Rubrivirga marina]
MRSVPALALLLAPALLAGCDAFESDDPFIPGEVVASVRYVEPAFLEAYAREHSIEVEQVALPPVYLVQTVVRSGAPEDYLAALSADPLVDTARVWRGDGVEVVVRRAADEEHVRALIAAQGGLDVVNVYRGQDLVVFGVPEGREERWVSRLEDEVFVVHAERNQMVYPR